MALSKWQTFNVRMYQGQLEILAEFYDSGGVKFAPITEIRIDGGAWSPMTNVGGNVMYKNPTGLADGNHLVEIREDSTKIYTLGNYHTGDACPDQGANDLLYYAKITNLYDVRSVTLTQYGGDATMLNMEHSITNGGTYKAATNVGLAWNTSWTEAELSAVDPEEVSIRYKSQPPAGVLCYYPSMSINWVPEGLAITKMTLSETHVNASSNGASDGSIDLTVNDGVGPFTYDWGGGIVTEDRSNLPAGNYSCTVTDTGDANYQQVINVTITEPAQEISNFPNSFAFSTPINPIRFKNNVAGEDMPMENYNYCDYPWENVKGAPNYELFKTTDSTMLQFRSDFEINYIKKTDLKDNSDVDLPVTLKVDNLSGGEQHTATITDNGLFEGVSSIKITRSDANPFPNVSIGSLVTLNNTANYDGSYSIVDYNLEDGNGWIVLKVAYVADEPCDIKFIAQTRYNIYELEINFVDWGEGTYRLDYIVSDGQAESIALVSESIKVMDQVSNTVVLKYSNYDNSAKVDWSTGIVMTKRHEGMFIKPIPADDTSSYRDSKDRPIILNAYVRNKEQYRLYELAWYSIQRLALIYRCDSLYLNTKKVYVEELPEPIYPENRYALGGQIVLFEEVGWIDEQNTHDTGGETPSLILGADNEKVLGV